MISVGGAVVIGGEGAVTADAVSDALKQILGEEPAGTSIVADGAGDVGLTSADVAALLASADLAAFQSAVGVGARGSGTLAARPASPAAGATHYCTDLDVLLRCRVAGTWRVAGELPLAVTRGPFALNTLITSAVNATSVSLGAGTTIAVGLHVDSLPGGSSLRLIAERHTDGPDTGWYLCAVGNRLKLYLAGINSGTPVDLGVDLVAGPCAVAVSIHASEVRTTVNGGAVVSAAITGTYVPPGTGAQLTLGGNYAPNATIFFGIGSMAWVAVWASALLDAAKQAVAAAYATYLPGEAGADPSATWAACRTAPGEDAQAQLIAATPVPLAIAAGLGRTVR